MPKSTASEMRAFRQVVLARDGTTCQCCGADCTLKLASIQHRIPRGMGGSALVNIPSNGVLVCGSATTPGSCHNWMEHENRAVAEAMGWLLPKLSGVSPSSVPLYTQPHGWVLLADDGTRTPCESPLLAEVRE
jgi:hypothetical protein